MTPSGNKTFYPSNKPQEYSADENQPLHMNKPPPLLLAHPKEGRAQGHKASSKDFWNQMYIARWVTRLQVSNKSHDQIVVNLSPIKLTSIFRNKLTYNFCKYHFNSKGRGSDTLGARLPH